jgi:hypothetical protein
MDKCINSADVPNLKDFNLGTSFVNVTVFQMRGKTIIFPEPPLEDNIVALKSILYNLSMKLN